VLVRAGTGANLQSSRCNFRTVKHFTYNRIKVMDVVIMRHIVSVASDSARLLGPSMKLDTTPGGASWAAVFKMIASRVLFIILRVYKRRWPVGQMWWRTEVRSLTRSGSHDLHSKETRDRVPVVSARHHSRGKREYTGTVDNDLGERA
jgi:hypothetical protein